MYITISSNTLQSKSGCAGKGPQYFDIDQNNTINLKSKMKRVIETVSLQSTGGLDHKT